MSRRRHPIRGFIFGLLLGLGLALLLMSYSLAPFGPKTPLALVIAGPVLGILVGTAGPGRGGKGTATMVILALAVIGMGNPGHAEAQPAGQVPPGGQSSLSGGCKGQALANADDGETVGLVIAPGTGASPTKPFHVDIDGSVAYNGSSASTIKNHKWKVAVYGLAVRSGGSPNVDGKTKTSGTITVKDFFPFKLAGLYYVSGDIKGQGGACVGSVWVKIIGSPVGSLPWILGMSLALIGLLGLLMSLPKNVGIPAPPAA